jgi:hypothetical protein
VRSSARNDHRRVNHQSNSRVSCVASLQGSDESPECPAQGTRPHRDRAAVEESMKRLGLHRVYRREVKREVSRRFGTRSESIRQDVTDPLARGNTAHPHAENVHPCADRDGDRPT